MMFHISCTSSCLNLRNALVPLMMPLAAYDTKSGVNGIKLPQHHVAPDFNCHDLRNTVLPLVTLSASHGANDTM